jgi:hypothetical protein
MTDEELIAFGEITAFSGKPSDLHPIKLDRWWRLIVGAPDLIYLQMGFHSIFEQIDKGSLAIKSMMDLVGRDLPVSHKEIAQRHIGQFNFHVSGGPDGTYKFSARWDKELSKWVLGCNVEAPTKMVPDLEKAVEKAKEVAAELDSQAASEA